MKPVCSHAGAHFISCLTGLSYQWAEDLISNKIIFFLQSENDLYPRYLLLSKSLYYLISAPNNLAKYFLDFILSYLNPPVTRA